jgi:hypothetical protein
VDSGLEYFEDFSDLVWIRVVVWELHSLLILNDGKPLLHFDLSLIIQWELHLGRKVYELLSKQVCQIVLYISVLLEV